MNHVEQIEGNFRKIIENNSKQFLGEYQMSKLVADEWHKWHKGECRRVTHR